MRKLKFRLRSFHFFRLVIFTLLPLNAIFISCNNIKSANKILKDEDSISPKYSIDLEANINHSELVPLSFLTDKVEYISLQTNQYSILEKLDQVAISDSFFFISDTKKIIQFDSRGRFLRQIGSNGRGPGEYGYVLDFCINNKCKEVYILSYPELLVFDFKGLFKRSIKIVFKSSHFSILNSDRFIFYQINLPSRTDERLVSWYLIDSTGKTLSTIRNFYKRINYPGMWIDKSPIYFHENNLYFMEFGVDTLYRLNNLKPEPYSIIKLGKMKMDHDFAFSQVNRQEELNYLNTKLRISDVFESKQSILIKLNWGFSDSTKFGIFDKIKSEIIFLSGAGFKNDWDSGPSFLPERQINDTLMVMWLESKIFKAQIACHEFRISIPKYPEKKKHLENLANSLKETDNPVLMIVRLKK